MTEQTKPAVCPAEIPDHRAVRDVIMDIVTWLDPHPPAKPNPQAALDCAEQWLVDNPLPTSTKRVTGSRLPDDHPIEVARRAEVAAQIRAENAMKGIDRRGHGVREIRCKCHVMLPNSCNRFQ